MQYVRHVDPSVFPAAEFRSHFIAEPASGLDTAYCIQTRVPPGKGTTRGEHVHPADQIYYILKGQMNAQLGDQEVVARPGELVFIPKGLPHWNWNTTDEEEVHFELIVPAPARDQLVMDTGSLPVPDVKGLQLVRTLDETKFDQARYSQIVIADRSTGCEHVSLGIFRAPAGTSTPYHAHRVDQVYFIMRGEMTLQIGFEECKAGPNSLVIIPAGMPHRNWNAGPELEYHINLRLPEPLPEWGPWDMPVTIDMTREV